MSDGVPKRGFFESREAFAERQMRFCRINAIQQTRFISLKITKLERNIDSLIDKIRFHLQQGHRHKAAVYVPEYLQRTKRLSELTRARLMITSMRDRIDDTTLQVSLESSVTAFTVLGGLLKDGKEIDMNSIMAQFDGCIEETSTSMSMVSDSLLSPVGAFDEDASGVSTSTMDRIFQEICPGRPTSPQKEEDKPDESVMDSELARRIANLST